MGILILMDTNNAIYGLTLPQITNTSTDRLRAILNRILADSAADGYTGGSWTENAVRAEMARRS